MMKNQQRITALGPDAADIQRIEIVNDGEDDRWTRWAPLLYYTVDAIALYYLTHPDILERHKDFVRSLWAKIEHRVSIWKAEQAIHSLPTTDISGITDITDDYDDDK